VKPGGASSAFFVTSRLMACLDQERESHFNTVEWKRQRLMAEEVDKIMEGNNDPEWNVGKLLDLPDGLGQQVYFGMDIGLVNDPTVITLWCVRQDAKKKTRLQLVRMFHLWRFREKQIRQCLYAIAWKYGKTLRGGGMDVTGLGLPIFQAMGDDEVCPQHLLEVSEGYVFNAKLPIGVDPNLVDKDTDGQMRDQYGTLVKEEEDPFTKIKRYVVYQTMIEASTRYLAGMVDSTYLQLPFDTEIASDMQGETEQRVKAMAGVKKKPSAFHILDSMRAMAMVYKHADRMQQVAVPEQRPVLARAVNV
jgi:hypothetical protein